VETDSGEVLAYYPYLTQARQMARKQLWHRSIRVEDDDDENDENDDSTQRRAATASSFATTLLVDYRHVLQHDLELAEAVESEFGRFEVFLQRAIATFVVDLCPELVDVGNNGNAQQQQQQSLYFCAFLNLPQTLLVRQLRMDRLGRLVAIKGTVTRTGEVRPELLEGSFRCQKCGLLATGVRQHYHYTRPQKCRNPRCANDNPLHFILETSNSIFTDWQKLRLQECSDEIPPGSMPRSMDIVVRNEMVERAKAGDAVTLVGALVVIPDGSALARVGEVPKSVKSSQGGGARGRGGDNNSGVRGLKALGVRELTYRTCFVATTVLPADVARLLSSRGASSLDLLLNSANPGAGGGGAGSSSSPYTEPTAEEVVLQMSRAERDEIRSMKDTPGLYERLVDSMCPNTFGHREVKKGILLQLLGGVHKTTMEGIKLRGDINVCIVGDPSTAKSQFLKYAHAFLPTRSVYTSGKASSAAGLTAAVQRDSETGEYCIEAGALMLADNGICCIDELYVHTIRETRSWLCSFHIWYLVHRSSLSYLLLSRFLFALAIVTRWTQRIKWRFTKPWNSKRLVLPRLVFKRH
jgi:DNA replication licensing factor MCM6